jgi:hypothetical protein
LNRRNVGARGGGRSRRDVDRAGRNHNAGGGLGLLVEVAGRGGGSLRDDGLVVVDGGVDNHGLGDDLGLVNEAALVHGRGKGASAEENGGENG